MKYLTAAIAATLLLLKVSAAPAHANIETRATEVCGYPVVPLFEVVSGPFTDHLWTTDATEAEKAVESGKYTIDHVQAYIYSNTSGQYVPNAMPLYRIYDAAGTDHYITTSWTEVENAVQQDGYEYQGITGYVYAEAQSDCAGTIPLYRTFNPTEKNHYYTTVQAHEESEVANGGYIYEGITAYVFAP